MGTEFEVSEEDTDIRDEWSTVVFEAPDVEEKKRWIRKLTNELLKQKDIVNRLVTPRQYSDEAL